MNHFAYRRGSLHAEDVDLAVLAAEVGTPFYCYATATLERHYRAFAEAVPKGLRYVSIVRNRDGVALEIGNGSSAVVVRRSGVR